MAGRKPILLLLGAAILLLFIFQALSVPPDQRPESALERVAERKKENDPRDSMYARWQLGERYFRQGNYDQAEKEYQRIIDDYPYTEIEYGFRTDDARQRLREIQALRRGERPATPFPEY